MPHFSCSYFHASASHIKKTNLYRSKYCIHFAQVFFQHNVFPRIIKNGSPNLDQFSTNCKVLNERRNLWTETSNKQVVNASQHKSNLYVCNFHVGFPWQNVPQRAKRKSERRCVNIYNKDYASWRIWVIQNIHSIHTIQKLGYSTEFSSKS